MLNIARIIILIALLSVVTIIVYYIIYSWRINAKIASGEVTGKRMIDIPKVIIAVILAALLIYSLIVTHALNESRRQGTVENRNTFSVIDLSDYTYSGFNGTLVGNDASYAKSYSKESNAGYQKSITHDGDFVFTAFTRVGQCDAFHPDYFCFVDYVGENSENLSLYEYYEFINIDSMDSIGGIGAGGGSIRDGFLIIGNLNKTEMFKITTYILDGKGEDAYFEAEHKAFEEDKGNFPNAYDYAVSTGSLVISLQ